MTNEIIKNYIQNLKNECDVTEEEAEKMLSFALNDDDVKQLIMMTIDNNIDKIL